MKVKQMRMKMGEFGFRSNISIFSLLLGEIAQRAKITHFEAQN
jgi:hypothetical protein